MVAYSSREACLTGTAGEVAKACSLMGSATETCLKLLKSHHNHEDPTPWEQKSERLFDFLWRLREFPFSHSWWNLWMHITPSSKILMVTWGIRTTQSPTHWQVVRSAMVTAPLPSIQSPTSGHRKATGRWGGLPYMEPKQSAEAAACGWTARKSPVVLAVLVRCCCCCCRKQCYEAKKTCSSYQS